MRHRLRDTALPVGVAFALGFASLGTVQKYLGTSLALVYLAAVLVAVPLAVRFGAPLFSRVVSERSALWLAAATVLALVVVFFVVYPHANDHASTTVGGSDRDEDANLATNLLIRLHYPYDVTTYLGNHITHLPGSLVLAIPFVLIGNSAYQNMFWLPALFAGLRVRTGSSSLALFWCWLLLAASPAVLREYVTGGDLIANGIYVLLATLGVLWAARRGGWVSIAAAAALGLTLSSRANYLLVLPLLASALLQCSGRRRAATDTVVALGVFLAVTLPFYLYDRAGFTPFHAADKLSQFDAALPHARVIILVLAVVLTLALTFTRMGVDGAALARNAAIVQVFILVWAVGLDSDRAGHVTFFFLVSGYGLNVVFFALFALAATVIRRRAGGEWAGEARLLGD